MYTAARNPLDNLPTGLQIRAYRSCLFTLLGQAFGWWGSSFEKERKNENALAFDDEEVLWMGSGT